MRRAPRRSRTPPEARTAGSRSAARPAAPSPADDFVLATATSLTGVAFTGLLPPPARPPRSASAFYAVFPTGSDAGRTPAVPTRGNSPADSALATRDSTGGGLTFSTSTAGRQLPALNSVLNGINRSRTRPPAARVR